MPTSLPLLRPFALSLLIVLLDACGGGSGGGSTSASSASQDAFYASVAGLRGTLDLSAKRVTLEWYGSFASAIRYQIEQQDTTGAWVAVDGVWASHDQQQNTMTWTGFITGAETLRVEAVLQDHNVPLVVMSQSPSTSLTFALPAQIPSIVLDQQGPLESPVNVSIANDESILAADESPPSVSYGIDTTSFSATGVAPGYLTSLQFEGFTTGTHLISASMGESTSTTLVISRSVQIHSSTAAVSISTASRPGALDVYVVATSDSGISSVVADLDSPTVLTETLTTPNACVPQPCGPGQPFNAYDLSFDTRSLSSGLHTIYVDATDNAGKTASGDTNFTLPAAPTATLGSPVDGASVAGTLHLAGTFSSVVPGALELMVTLSGVPVYDTTVVNTGAKIPFSADVSLAGVAPGGHTVGVYARVGNTSYTFAATALVQVMASP